ncbi:MAG TPA: glycosyltransferase family 39 protein [Oscillatoriaceae cyanobacterium M33_DOE_052]|uniref:Glycosyltransferase RgtA/B/C/D-like domain-containing protein n=1 Tax=Planktothricoides sp. SpSt-374 TaxID=2282167 RepID=A0A7C3ZXK1_9CYAN|nr:glycosyltransferase family 39 protein [Oscillatoriaceae cyanobacterium M33_DOE_052]
MIKQESNSPNWFRFLGIAILVIGICFRFAHLDSKVYWHDEAYTSLRISGYTSAELRNERYERGVIRPEDLQKYQGPNDEKSLMGTINGLAKEEPQLPPLYFLMVRLWVQYFGYSVAMMRSFSAIISLLAFPCIYFLAVELFKSSSVGWLAVSLIAVSPFHLLYAQEARPYSLWTVTILLSSWTLLRAIRTKTKLSWVIYAGTLTVGLYGYLFSILVAIAHGIYVFLTEGFRWSKTAIAYVMSFLAAIVAFSPWLLFVISGLRQIEGGVSKSTGEGMSVLKLTKNLVENSSKIFIDFMPRLLQPDDSPYVFLLFLPIILSLVGLFAYSVYFVVSRTEQRVWLLIVTLGAVPLLTLILTDLILQEAQSSASRYLIPSYLAVELSVAYLLATNFTSIWQQRLLRLVTIGVILGGVLSCAIISPAKFWWNKHGEYYTPQIARRINQSSQPLVVTGGNPGRVFALNYLLDNQVSILLLNKGNPPNHIDANQFSDVFFFTPSQELRLKLAKRGYKLKPLINEWEGRSLWRLDK